ncbi:MAG: fibronectin type III domain-containing protein, partial [Nanoarchaeota archaeon]|nr:fibronectin type III domain-containing protein [Nanoarchaeota archaeon]
MNRKNIPLGARSSPGLPKKLSILSVLLVLLLFVNLPVVTALQISNIRAEDITSSSASVLWETDEPANSFVNYGTSKETVSSRIGDAASVTEHRLALQNLPAGQTYYYAVESNALVNNNNGEFYSFTTAAADTTAPEIAVTLPARIAGSSLTLNGSTEAGADVSLLVNETLAAFTSAGGEGSFLFTDVALQEETLNSIRIEAEDAAGNRATFAGQVYADTSRPTIVLEAIPELIEERTFTLQGSISEEVTYEVFVNNESQAQGEGTQLTAPINLEEGSNPVRMVLTDRAGWETVEELRLISDTQAPTITAELEKGNEYYEGNVETTIRGETEPGSTIYLYVYKQRTFQYQPDFEKAWERVTADAQGKFSFRDIDLEDEPIRLEDLAPRQVPSRLLEETSLQPLSDGQEYWTYSVFLIAEDRTGKTGYWETRVTANTCFSDNYDIVMQSVPELQFPLKLEPRLLDEGRETIQAVFSLDYQGSGVPVMRGGEEIAPGYQIQGVRFQPACTQSMLEEEGSGTALGCTAMTRREPFSQVSPEQSSVYVQWNLGSLADVSERKENFWDDFTERRRIVFPIKVQLTYQDRLGEDEWSAPKVQTSCKELSYFVDIPLESSELIPDFLADEGVSALDFTVRQLDDMRTMLEDVHIIMGISTGASWLLHLVARWMRIASENIEGALSTTCPGSREQAEMLYLRDTLDEWKEFGIANLPNLPQDVVNAINGDPDALKKVTFEENCPTTATFWDLEESINTVFRFAADRAVCRTGDSAVPAGWTEDQELAEIQRKIAEEQSCGVTGRGIPLQRIENCREFVEQNPVALPSAVAI